jgi:pantoate--beta-alanine ligase
METFHTIGETRKWLALHRAGGREVGFVPTMGALHEGHLDLVRRAARENDLVVCSIFVNPIQFNNPEDLEKYPRTLEEDKTMLLGAGCHLVFAPSVAEMYPDPATETYEFGPLSQVMEGAFRPGHFNGVAIVVRKLFDIAEPDRAYFGEKDYQQLKIIQALVRMHSIPVEIIPCATVREADGLAMSSRNRRLTVAERIVAPEIYRALREAKQWIRQKGVEEVKKMVQSRLESFGFVIDYIEISSGNDLQPLNFIREEGPVRMFIAAYLGNVRLIDNLEIIS